MKTILSKSIFLIIFLLLVLFGFWKLYAYHFPGGLSSDPLRWSQFGDFYNGVISPIFAAINIYLFWYLTRVIDLKNERRQLEIQYDEKRRQEQNAEHEKAMILMQFRKAEIDRLEEALSNAFIPRNIEGYDLLRSLISLMNYLATFNKTKLDIFDLDEESPTAKNILQLCKDLSIYLAHISNNEKTPEDITKRIAELEFSIINDLQNITLGVKNS